MAEDILRFGVPKNFDTEADEAGHKPSKKATGVVQKNKAKFDEQVALRLLEVCWRIRTRPYALTRSPNHE